MSSIDTPGAIKRLTQTNLDVRGALNKALLDGFPGQKINLYDRGNWDAVTVYVQGELVYYVYDLGGPSEQRATWIARVGSTNVEPGTNIETWAPFAPEGAEGPEGKSAYAVAVVNGFNGTEVEWVASLQGPEGAPGTGTQGDPGQSAYQLAQAAGFVGTEQEYLASLKGADGTGIGALADIPDTDVASPSIDDALRYDGVKWGKYPLATKADLTDLPSDLNDLALPSGEFGSGDALVVDDDSRIGYSQFVTPSTLDVNVQSLRTEADIKLDTAIDGVAAVVVPSVDRRVWLADRIVSDVRGGFADQYNSGAGVTGGGGFPVKTVTAYSNTTPGATNGFKEQAALGNAHILIDADGSDWSALAPVNCGSNLTIEAAGLNVTLPPCVFAGKQNFIVAGVKFASSGIGNGQNTNTDAIQILDGSHGFIVAWCDLTSGRDGLIDVTRGNQSEFGAQGTVCWNRIHDHPGSSMYPLGYRDGKAALTGGSADEQEYARKIGGVWQLGPRNPTENFRPVQVTFHHNLWQRNKQRQPRAVAANVHVYNNVYDDWGDETGSGSAAVDIGLYGRGHVEKNVAAQYAVNDVRTVSGASVTSPDPFFITATDSANLNGLAQDISLAEANKAGPRITYTGNTVTGAAVTGDQSGGKAVITSTTTSAFAIPYTYTAVAADSTLRTLVEASAGATLPVPSGFQVSSPAVASRVDTAFNRNVDAGFSIVAGSGIEVVEEAGTLTLSSEGTNVQTFRAGDYFLTWRKPIGATRVEVFVRGAGGGGGGGAKNAAATVRGGGASGGAGNTSLWTYHTSELGGTEAVTVGAGGAGGLGATVSGTGGAAGSQGAGSFFGAHLHASGGAGGAGGTTTAGGATGAVQGRGMWPGMPGVQGGGAAASGTAATQQFFTAFGQSLFTSGCGGGGAGTDAAEVAWAASDGGHGGNMMAATTPGGAKGGSHADGSPGAAAGSYSGSGGGGGGRGTSGNAGKGAAGGGISAGGGGGGGGGPTGNGGDGGVGTGGIVKVVSYR